MNRYSYETMRAPGGLEAQEIHPGSRYELSDGHPIYCAPSGGGHAGSSSASSMVLGSDPDVDEYGMDVGYTSRKDMLRAPDVAVGNVPSRPGWVQGAPKLALEVVDTGQDEKDLMVKVQEFLEAGTLEVWVVRLVGPRRVEVWRQDGTATMYLPGQQIRAPGILRRPVLVDALFDRELAREAALANLLARHGYESLDEVKQEGRQEGQVESLRGSLRAVLEARGLALSAEQDARVEAADADTLQRWIRSAATANDSASALGG